MQLVSRIKMIPTEPLISSSVHWTTLVYNLEVSNLWEWILPTINVYNHSINKER
jgi:hypothetical protein